MGSMRPVAAVLHPGGPALRTPARRHAASGVPQLTWRRHLSIRRARPDHPVPVGRRWRDLFVDDPRRWAAPIAQIRPGPVLGRCGGVAVWRRAEPHVCGRSMPLGGADRPDSAGSGGSGRAVWRRAEPLVCGRSMPLGGADRPDSAGSRARLVWRFGGGRCRSFVDGRCRWAVRIVQIRRGPVLGRCGGLADGGTARLWTVDAAGRRGSPGIGPVRRAAPSATSVVGAG